VLFFKGPSKPWACHSVPTTHINKVANGHNEGASSLLLVPNHHNSILCPISLQNFAQLVKLFPLRLELLIFFGLFLNAFKLLLQLQ
jgi:hypothetical protein